MALPERLYYPLGKAAEKLTSEGMFCDVDDLIHLAAIGKLEVCVRIMSCFLCKNTQLLLFNAPKWMLDPSSFIANENYNFHGFDTDFGYICLSNNDEDCCLVKLDDCIFLVDEVNTLFAVPKYDLQVIENNKDESLLIHSLTLPRGCKLFDESGIELDENLEKEKLKSGTKPFFSNNFTGMKIAISSLVITTKELALLKAGGGKTQEKRTQDQKKQMEWILHARSKGLELKRLHPSWSQARIAAEVSKFLKSNDITGKGYQVPSTDTIKRHALQNLGRHSGDA